MTGFTQDASTSELLLEARGIGSAEARASSKPIEPSGAAIVKSPRPLVRPKKRDRLVPTVIVEKSALFRAGLARILAGRRFRITAACASPPEIPESALSQRQCLALVGCDNGDLGTLLPEIARLKNENAALRTIILSEQFHPEEWLAALEAGADGYLIKNEITPEALLQSLELVLLGGVVIPQGLSRLLTARGPTLGDMSVVLDPAPACDEVAPEKPAEAMPNGELARLSNREQMILMQLTQGASNKHIARVLNIAEATVKVHVKSLLRKIRVNNRTQAAMWAIDHMRKAPG